MDNGGAVRDDEDVEGRRDTAAALGIPSRDDRRFVYRSLAALCSAALPLADAAKRMAAALRTAPDKESNATQRKLQMVDALAKGGDPDASVGSLLGRIPITGEEACMLSLTLREATPAATAAVMGAAASFLSEGAR